MVIFGKGFSHLGANVLKKRRNRIRIIAGRLRGRFVTFSDHDGLRPTGDRLRETLFSWLQPFLHGSHCLDMFAGSGVLGFESISRGADSAVLFEKSAAVVAALEENAVSLDLKSSKIVCSDSLNGNKISDYCGANKIDIAFIDPPFGENLQQRAVDTLHASGVLAVGALVAVENDKRKSSLVLPAGWSQVREKFAGEVHLQLLRSNDGLQSAQGACNDPV